MPYGSRLLPAPLPGTAYSVTPVPAVVIRPTAPLSLSVNHKAPSGPDVMFHGLKNELDVYSVMTPAVVILPILSPLNSVNHKLLSGPTVMESGPLFAVGVAYSVTTPPVVIRPILLNPLSANHSAPSGPAVM
jgi:hypothetical protein